MTREEFYDQLCDAISTRNQDHADDLRDKIMAEYDRLVADVERLTSFSAPMAATLATLRELTASDDVVETVRELYGEAERLTAELEAIRSATCKWHLEEPDWNAWRGECGEFWNLETDDPKTNGMNFCPNCGKVLVQLPAAPAQEVEP